MSLGAVVRNAILNYAGGLGAFRLALEKTGLFTGGRLFCSVESQIDEIVADLIRLRAEEKARKEKEEQIKNVKMGDSVRVFGIGAIVVKGSRFGGVEYFGAFPTGSKFIVSLVGEEYVHITDRAANKYLVYFTQISEVFPAPVEKVRGPERRVERQDMVRTGSELHLVKTLEAMNRSRRLSEDETEALKAAQARIRKDGSANGFRKGGDRRINGQF